MPLADASTIAEATGHSEAVVSFATARLRQAERDCRRELGDARYEALATRDADDEEKDDLVEAESLLAFAHALPMGNLKPDENGTLTRARGMDRSRREIMSQRELAAYQRQFKGQAHTILNDLTDTSQTADLPIAAV